MSEDKKLSDLLNDFQRKGRYSFERSQVGEVLSISPASLSKSLARLAEKGRIKRLRKSFYVIIPIEFTKQGLPPWDWFIEDLMRSLALPYYIGLLSAAALHGAAHQQVQQLQIIVPKQERPIAVEGLSLRFFRKMDLSSTPLISRKGHSGMLPVSTPEATALDLVRYARHIGGLDAVLTVLSELAETMDPANIKAACQAESEIAHVQRLGWLFDHLGHITLADAIYSVLANAKSIPRAVLDPSAPRVGTFIRNRWRVLENAIPQSDL